jgi:hypothetical protein
MEFDWSRLAFAGRFSSRLAGAIACGLWLTVQPAAAQQQDMAQREALAAEAANGLMQQLSAALTQAMSEGGPVKAIEVCRDLAPAIAGEISRANGWRVTRIGTKVRNPLLGMADAWEQQVMADFEVRAREGEGFPDMTYSEVVDNNGQQQFRFMKAIPMGGQCVACHGSDAQIPSIISDALAEHYPLDQARGYEPGQLRGAVSITQPLSLP